MFKPFWKLPTKAKFKQQWRGEQVRYLTYFSGDDYATIPTYTTDGTEDIEITCSGSYTGTGNRVIIDGPNGGVNPRLIVFWDADGTLDVSSNNGTITVNGSGTQFPNDGKLRTIKISSPNANQEIATIAANRNFGERWQGFVLSLRISKIGNVIHDYQLDTNTGTFVDKVNPVNTGTITGTPEYFLSRLVGSDWVVTDDLSYTLSDPNASAAVTIDSSDGFTIDGTGLTAADTARATLSTALFVGQWIRQIASGSVTTGSITAPNGANFDPANSTVSDGGAFGFRCLTATSQFDYIPGSASTTASMTGIRLQHIIPIA